MRWVRWVRWIIGAVVAGGAAFGGAVLGGKRGAGGGSPAGDAADEGAEQRSEPRDQPPAGRSAAEWTTLAVSVVICAGLAGAALVEHFARAEPAGVRIAVTVLTADAERRDGQFYVPYEVTNDGAEPAEAVTLVFEVMDGELVLEESTAEIAFMPTSGSASGELITSFDPATYTITGRVGTVQVP